MCLRPLICNDKILLNVSMSKKRVVHHHNNVPTQNQWLLDSDNDGELYDANCSYGSFPISSSLPGSSPVPFLSKQKGPPQTDDENDKSHSADEFNEDAHISHRSLRTGRQRKKLAARSKGGEFQSRRKKRRVYFCSISSLIDIHGLNDFLSGPSSLRSPLKGWECKVYGDVLRMYKSGKSSQEPSHVVDMTNESNTLLGYESATSVIEGELEDGNSGHPGHPPPLRRSASEGEAKEYFTRNRSDCNIGSMGTQEVFVFDFGAAVFWGFSRGEESRVLATIRLFVTKGMVDAHEFESGEDDMAFIIGDETSAAISIANDVIMFPDNSSTKQRLSVSFAIAQSSVLAIFESRIELKIEEYKYIPETLAACGKVHLSQKQLGIMIGEVFVIRHDLNLHTEILDTPDFFWREEKYELEYSTVLQYLEMQSRTEVSNKRLDMLRELLDVLQQQMENAHAVKLEWIVIWLIVAEVVLQSLTIFGGALGFWKGR